MTGHIYYSDENIFQSDESVSKSRFVIFHFIGEYVWFLVEAVNQICVQCTFSVNLVPLKLSEGH